MILSHTSSSMWFVFHLHLDCCWIMVYCSMLSNGFVLPEKYFDNSLDFLQQWPVALLLAFTMFQFQVWNQEYLCSHPQYIDSCPCSLGYSQTVFLADQFVSHFIINFRGSQFASQSISTFLRPIMHSMKLRHTSLSKPIKVKKKKKTTPRQHTHWVQNLLIKRWLLTSHTHYINLWKGRLLILFTTGIK